MILLSILAKRGHFVYNPINFHQTSSEKRWDLINILDVKFAVSHNCADIRLPNSRNSLEKMRVFRAYFSTKNIHKKADIGRYFHKMHTKGGHVALNQLQIFCPQSRSFFYLITAKSLQDYYIFREDTTHSTDPLSHSLISCSMKIFFSYEMELLIHAFLLVLLIIYFFLIWKNQRMVMGKRISIFLRILEAFLLYA